MPRVLANDRSTLGTGPAWPLDDADPPDSARSALSAPENFIAESPITSFLHRHLGRRRWSVALAGVVIAGAAAAYVGPALFPRSVSVAKDGARVGADLSVRPAMPGVGAPNGEARPGDTASAPQPRREPAAESAAPATGTNFQQRLATAGLPNSDENAIGTTDARVTAFPPSAPVEPEPPSTAPPQAEPAVAEKHEAAAVEASPTKALSPEPNPKLDALVARADHLLASGEVAKARQFFSRIAADGDPRGAWGMARSYDEQILRTLPVGGLTPNPAQAKWWYEKARGLEAAEGPDHGGRADAAH